MQHEPGSSVTKHTRPTDSATDETFWVKSKHGLLALRSNRKKQRGRRRQPMPRYTLEDRLSPGDDRPRPAARPHPFRRQRRRRRRQRQRRRSAAVDGVAEQAAELVTEAEHQQEVDGGVEDDEAVGHGGVHLQPARVATVGARRLRHRRVDGIEHESEQRHGAADGEHQNDDDRKSRGAQLALLRRVERHPFAPGVG